MNSQGLTFLPGTTNAESGQWGKVRDMRDNILEVLKSGDIFGE